MTMRDDSTKPPRRVLLLLGYHLTATVEGVAKYAREAGWTLDCRTLRSGVLPEPGGFDGILGLLGGGESRPELTDFVRKAGVPVVDMHADAVGDVAAGRVLVDNRKIGELAAQHFASRGFSRCLFCCRNLSDWSARERHQEFQTVLDGKKIGHETFEQVAARADPAVAGDFVRCLMAELERLPKPLGVFAENDDVATLVLDACFRLHLRVPEQVAVLGCNNDILVTDFARVPLSSIDPDLVCRAYRAAQMLDRLMDGEPIHGQPVLIDPLGVVTRQSTDILAVPDLRVAEALTHIRRHFTNLELTPDSVSEACGVPPRTLARLFKQHLARSVANEIGSLRRQRAQQLLAAGMKTVTEVAFESGFASNKHMRRSFQRHLGMTPREWCRDRTPGASASEMTAKGSP